MMLLPDAWTWDFWLADDGERFHAFFLRASRALLDPDARHWRAALGHAVSADLRSWTVVPDALVHSDGPAFDDRAIWTGCVVASPSGGWRLFYTGLSHETAGDVQRIGAADSADLVTWTRSSPAGFAPDPRWYEHETWRDPWVFRDAGGDGWHMLVTARALEGADRDTGVVGHATSPDLTTWTARPPLSAPGAGFGHLEVMQVVAVEDVPVLLFSCLSGDLDSGRREAGSPGGIWALPLTSAAGPWDLREAQPLTGPDLYAGRITHDRSGQAVLLAFRNEDSDGSFVGGIVDPLPVTWSAEGALIVRP